jgi:hypothetical protein
MQSVHADIEMYDTVMSDTPSATGTDTAMSGLPSPDVLDFSTWALEHQMQHLDLGSTERVMVCKKAKSEQSPIVSGTSMRMHARGLQVASST